MACLNSDRVLGMSRHTAAMVIGWLSAVISLIVFMIGIGILANLDRIIGSSGDSVPSITTEYSLWLSVVSAIYLLEFVASILLIYGVAKNSHRMLLPWLIHNTILLGVQGFLTTAAYCFTAFVNPGHFDELLTLFGISIIIGLGWCAWRVIISLFRHIRNEKASKGKEHNKGVSNLSNYLLLNEFENENVKPYPSVIS